jgi:hypothetical protein
MKFYLLGLVSIVGFLIIVYSLLAGFSDISHERLGAALGGGALAILFVTAGFISFMYALKFQQKKFNKIVGISILVRLVLMTCTILVILVYFNIDQAGFLIGMFISYFITQILEVISFNRARIGKA